MFRITLAAALAALFCVPVSAEDKKPEKKPTVELHGDLKDRALDKEKPENGIIVATGSIFLIGELRALILDEANGSIE